MIWTKSTHIRIHTTRSRLKVDYKMTREIKSQLLKGAECRLIFD